MLLESVKGKKCEYIYRSVTIWVYLGTLAYPNNVC